MNIIKPIELSAENFKQFGTILSSSDKEPVCDDRNVIYRKQIFMTEIPKISTGLMTCKRRDMILEMMEKHMETPEIMVNLGGDAILLLAENDYSFKATELDKIRAFVIHKGDGYVINKGVWHWASYPIGNEDVDYLTAFAYNTENQDIINGTLEEAIIIQL